MLKVDQDMASCSSSCLSSPQTLKPLSKSKLVVAATTEKRSVKFSGKVKVRSIRTVDELTDDEFDAAWFSREEFQRIRERETKLALLASEQTPSNQEAMLTLYAIASEDIRLESRRKIKEYAYCILAEQERQWNKEANDPFLLASVCHFLATDSREKASQRGNVLAKHIMTIDQREVRREHRTARRPKRQEHPTASPPLSPPRIAIQGMVSSSPSPSPCTRRWTGNSHCNSPTRVDSTMLHPRR